MVKRLGKVESYKLKQGIFAAVLVIAIAAAYFLWQNASNIAILIVVSGLVVIFALVVRQYDFLLTLKEYERAVVFRVGRIHRVAGPGWAFIAPLFESFKIVDLRTQTLDVQPQTVITRDNVVVKIDAVIYLYIKKDSQSIINSVIEVDNFKNGATQF
ncbi:MAG: SPFH domain-containing protein, partial [archaeon]